jgi:hypothetical protein
MFPSTFCLIEYSIIQLDVFIYSVYSISGWKGGTVMKTGLNDAIRKFATFHYVRPAVLAGDREFAIPVKAISEGLKAQGVEMSGRTPQICSALRTGKFLRQNGLEISSIAGPPSGQSPTVVFHYRVTGSEAGMPPSVQAQGDEGEQSTETPEEWAHRLTGKLCGLLKEEITAMGGTEAFIRWVRSQDEEDAA